MQMFHWKLRIDQLKLPPPHGTNTALIKMLKEKSNIKNMTIIGLPFLYIISQTSFWIGESCFDTWWVESAIIKNPKSFWSYIKS